MTNNRHAVLALNAGSSSLKFAYFSSGAPLCRGKFERLGHPSDSLFSITGVNLPTDAQPRHIQSHEHALDWIVRHAPLFSQTHSLAAVGHRVVHGGNQFNQPLLVQAHNLADMEKLAPLAPLHQPHNLAGIKFLLAHHPNLPQVACFDTAFHTTQSQIERLLPLPRSFRERGIQRYGFHGLSYESIAHSLQQSDPENVGGRAIVLHLGNGASGCAMKNGISVATTMAFTTVDGLMMGTRTGALDPGLLVHLLQHEGLSLADVHDLLYKQSGLLGVSGISSDMRDLLNSTEPAAREAVDLFCHRAAREIGSLAVTLAGLDTLIFTGGIGENAPAVREKILHEIAWLAPTAQQQKLNTLVVPTDEESVIARHTERLTS